MRPRPLVDFDVPRDRDSVLASVKHALEADPRCGGHVGRGEFSLEVAGEERHVFSPRVSLEVRESPVGTHVRGRFGPHPNLWTWFVFVYAAQVAAFVAGSVYGGVQWLLEEPPTGLLVAGATVFSLGVSCAIDLMGRARGRPQMHIVWAFLHDAFPDMKLRDVAPEDPRPQP